MGCLTHQTLRGIMSISARRAAERLLLHFMSSILCLARLKGRAHVDDYR
jgi:hypothetical protein